MTRTLVSAAWGNSPDNCSDTATSADKIACFSQSGQLLSMLAPGSEITAAGITESGTSQATPHAAGAAAVLAAVKPTASALKIERSLTDLDRPSPTRATTSSANATLSATVTQAADGSAGALTRASVEFDIVKSANLTNVPDYRFYAVAGVSGIATTRGCCCG